MAKPPLPLWRSVQSQPVLVAPPSTRGPGAFLGGGGRWPVVDVTPALTAGGPRGGGVSLLALGVTASFTAPHACRPVGRGSGPPSRVKA